MEKKYGIPQCLCYIILMLALTFLPLNASVKERLEIKKWETYDLVFIAKRLPDDPFRDVMGGIFTSWYVVIHDPFSEAVDPKPNFRYYKYFKNILEKYKFETLEPAHGLSSSGLYRSNGKDTYIYYIPGDNAAIDIKNLGESDALKITWFNPVTGEYRQKKDRPWSAYFTLKPEYKGVDNILTIHSEWLSCQYNRQMNRL